MEAATKLTIALLKAIDAFVKHVDKETKGLKEVKGRCNEVGTELRALQNILEGYTKSIEENWRAFFPSVQLFCLHLRTGHELLAEIRKAKPSIISSKKKKSQVDDFKQRLKDLSAKFKTVLSMLQDTERMAKTDIWTDDFGFHGKASVDDVVDALWKHLKGVPCPQPMREKIIANWFVVDGTQQKQLMKIDFTNLLERVREKYPSLSLFGRDGKFLQILKGEVVPVCASSAHFRTYKAFWEDFEATLKIGAGTSEEICLRAKFQVEQAVFARKTVVATLVKRVDEGYALRFGKSNIHLDSDTLFEFSWKEWWGFRLYRVEDECQLSKLCSLTATNESTLQTWVEFLLREVKIGTVHEHRMLHMFKENASTKLSKVEKEISRDRARRPFEMKGFVSQTVCNGVYAHKSGDTFNGEPVFEKVGGGRWMCFTSSKYWRITDDRSDFPKNCGFVKSASCGHPSPHDVRTWQQSNGSTWTAIHSATLTALDVHQYADAVARIKANATKSFEMKGLESSTNPEVAACNGVYTHKPDDTFNGKPVFEKVGGGRWMYFTSSKYWMITYDRSHFPKNCGFVTSASCGHPSPHDVCTWERGNGGGKLTAIRTAKLTALTAYEVAAFASRWF